MNIIDITDAEGHIIAPEWLGRAEAVHRQLRPHLPDYSAAIRRVCGDGGRMCVAALDEKVVGAAIYRIYETTSDGRRLYVDDLVTDEGFRSKGVGHALMAHLQSIAHAEGCDTFTLDSGTHRHQAHKFYFREGMVIAHYAFRKPLTKQTH